MIFMSNKNINDALYIDYESIVLCPGSRDIITEEMTEELEEISDFIEEVLRYIYAPFIYEINAFYDNYPNSMPKSNKFIIDWFLYNFHNIMKKSKYYENIAGDFCDAFNSNKDYHLYMYIDSIELMVYDNNKKEFYIRDENDKETKIITYTEYKKRNKNENKWICNNDIFEERQEIFERNLSLAKSKKLNKDLMFIVIFKFACTIRNYPMTIIDSRDLKIN